MSSGDENQSARAAAGSPDDDSPVDGGSGGGSGSSELSDPRHALQPGCWYASGGGGSVELSDPRHGQPGGWDRSNIGGTVELSDTRPRHGHPGWYGGGGGRGSVEPSDPRHGRPGWYGINDDGGSTDVLDPRRGQSAWYGINGGGSGGAGPSNYVQQQHVGYPYWHVGGGGGDSSGGGSAFNLRDGFGAGDAHGIGPHDWRAANGVNRNRNYGGGTNDDGSWYWANGGAGDDGGSWYWQNGSASSGDWRDPAYVTDSFYENGEGSAFSSPPRVNAGIYQPQQPVTGYYWPGSGSNGGVDRPHAEFMPGGSNGGSSSFPLPRIPNGMPYEHQRARADHYWSNSAADDHRFDVLHGNGRPTFASPPRNGFGMHAAPDGRAPHSPPQRCAEVNELVANSLRDLTVGNNDSISAVHRGLPESLDEEGQALNAGDHDAPSYHGGLFNDADPYAGMRLEDVRGRMARVARDLTGCQFLARMVDEGGAAAARHVLDELAGDVVRLMADSPGHELVAKLAGFWTDEETIARVLGLLRAAPTGLILAAAKSHPGSNILQTLVTRISDSKLVEQAESFARTLAGVGESSVLSLIQDVSGGNLIMKCLEMLSARQTQFIVRVALRFSHRVCHDRHGCHVYKSCIDHPGDLKTRDALIHAVCRDALPLAEHTSGNYAVQHVIEAAKEVPWAADAVHQAFRGRYVSLARQKNSSHVVQRCLEKFSTPQRDEIVYELLKCERQCSFGDLISDPYANYVLQTAMEFREGQMHSTLINTIYSYRDILGGDRFAKQVFQKLWFTRGPFHR